jgi:hypothetical protein
MYPTFKYKGPRIAWIGNPHQQNCMVEAGTWSLHTKIHPKKNRNAHGAEELGLCPLGLACQAGAWGRYIGFCLGYGHILILKISGFFGRLSITLSHDEILKN